MNVLIQTQSTAAKGAQSATKKYILGNKFEEIHLGERRSHDGSFLKGLGEGCRENCILSIRVEFAKLGSKSRRVLILFEFCLKRYFSCIYKWYQSSHPFDYITEEDSVEEELANFVAFIGITEFVEGETDTDDDQSGADGDDGISYQELCQTVVQIGKENLCLKKEKSWLEDTVINPMKELDDERKKEANTSDLKKENVRLVVQIELLEKQVKNEKARSSDLNAKLEHHYKTVRMLTGSKELDKILSLGRQDQTSQGLGYTGYGKSDTEPIKFVPSSYSKGRTTTERTTSKTGAEKVKNLQKVGRSEIQQERGCYYCGKPGHIKKKCNHFREKVNQLLRQGNMNILGWAAMVAIGMNTSVSVRVSNELGANHPRTAKFSLVVAVITSTLIGVIVSTVLLIFRNHYPSLFVGDEEVIILVKELTPILALSIVINNVQPVLSGNPSN
ncbi:hypothetical protein DY000_02025331 [Brassica cretica]|uniref:CCHC-type domain-containing protein n=1 Tax=Brassica cretica TaxID=69181 RepID=A0ABQ7E8D5_BRACR|nr:hypothetical protein DY000_02025331 [Brassica cretica]